MKENKMECKKAFSQRCINDPLLSLTIDIQHFKKLKDKISNK